MFYFMNFQSIVMIVAIIILIITLTMIGVSLSNLNSQVKYPPVIADCPDYWSIETQSPDENGNTDFICKNEKSLGHGDSITGCNEFDNSLSKFKGMGGLCEKRKWADKCNVTWDGVTNNPNAKDTCY